jgi:hypothetical protein
MALCVTAPLFPAVCGHDRHRGRMTQPRELTIAARHDPFATLTFLILPPY